MHIVFARHGETVFNSQERFQGISDSPLTKKGIKQAERLGGFLESYALKNFLLSPLPRVYETCEIANAKLGAEYEILEILKEICYGEWEAQKKAPLKRLPMWRRRMRDRFNFKHPGSYKGILGESYSILYNRIEPFLKNLWVKPAFSSSEAVCVLSHIGVMRCVYKYFTKLSDSDTGKLEIPNNRVLIVETQQNGFDYLEREL